MIKFKAHNGKPIHINPNKILYITESNLIGETSIWLAPAAFSIGVKGTLDEIAEKIESYKTASQKK